MHIMNESLPNIRDWHEIRSYLQRWRDFAMPQNKNNKKGQVNIAQKKAGGKTASSGKKKPSKQSKTVIIVILATIIIAMLIFLIVGGVMVYQAAFSPKSKVKEISDMTSHTKTPSEHRDKVAYYVVGLLGEETEDPTEMLSILCWDKEKNTMSILQLPQDTYLGTSGQWAVKRAADVFGKPKELDWCISCRRNIGRQAFPGWNQNFQDAGLGVRGFMWCVQPSAWLAGRRLFSLPAAGFGQACKPARRG